MSKSGLFLIVVLFVTGKIKGFFNTPSSWTFGCHVH